MTNALYYPTIDIFNEDWLKTAVLFWDEINTIVPESIKYPYSEMSTQYLADEGILRPLRVNSNMKIIEDLTIDSYNYLNTDEGIQLLKHDFKSYMPIHREKLPKEIEIMLWELDENLPDEIRAILEINLKEHKNKNKSYEGNWLYVNSKFVNFYMTLLANKLSEAHSIALLTDNTLSSNLTDVARLNNQKSKINTKPINLTQGLLTNLIVESIKINPTSSLEKIIDFKRHHRDELGLFRTNLMKLTQNISKEKPIEAIKQEIQDVYKDEFLPAYHNLQKALSSSRVKWVADNFMKVTLISTSTSALLPNVLGLSVPQALFVGTGISVITSLISYNEDKRKVIRENPYSYLLAINNEL